MCTFEPADMSKFYILVDDEIKLRIESRLHQLIINFNDVPFAANRITNTSVLDAGNKRIKVISSRIYLKHEVINKVDIKIKLVGTNLGDWLAEFFEINSQKKINKDQIRSYNINIYVSKKIGDSTLLLNFKPGLEISAEEDDKIIVYMMYEDIIMQMMIPPLSKFRVRDLQNKFLVELKKRCIHYHINSYKARWMHQYLGDRETFDAFCGELRKLIKK